jgi:hypothetical protein
MTVLSLSDHAMFQAVRRSLLSGGSRGSVSVAVELVSVLVMRLLMPI